MEKMQVRSLAELVSLAERVGVAVSSPANSRCVTGLLFRPATAWKAMTTRVEVVANAETALSPAPFWCT
jgi:hypothetical protein